MCLLLCDLVAKVIEDKDYDVKWHFNAYLNMLSLMATFFGFPGYVDKST